MNRRSFIIASTTPLVCGVTGKPPELVWRVGNRAVLLLEHPIRGVLVGVPWKVLKVRAGELGTSCSKVLEYVKARVTAGHASDLTWWP